jgi:two-component system response regulator YesN
MYSLLIIDDEPVAREGIAQNIAWAEHGFELLGTCADGSAGIEQVEQHQPDVVIADICMPFVDGLQFAGFVGERYPDTKVILLTGYDEFQYAQEAVKLKVTDFILKPITPQELRQVLDRTKAELDAERTERRQMSRLREQLQESLPLLRERFLNRLVRGIAERVEIADRLELLNLDLSGPYFEALIVDLDTEDADEELMRFGVQKIVEECVEGSGAVVFRDARENVVVLLQGGSAGEARTAALETAEAIADRSEGRLSRTVSVGYSEPAEGWSGIPVVYRDARTALAQRMVLGARQVIGIGQVRGAEQQSSSGRQDGAGLPDAERRTLTRLIKTATADEAVGALGRVVHRIRRDGSVGSDYEVMIQRVLADVLNAFEELGVHYRELSDAGENPFAELAGHKTIDDMERWLAGLIRSAASVLAERQEYHSKAKAIRAREYIDEHFTNPDLSLTEVCRELAISRSYFSPIFKQHTGMTFVEYLTSLRVEKAKELLRSTDLKSYEIAEAVGYTDQHYFSLTFKKQSGMSPTEFREACREATP